MKIHYKIIQTIPRWRYQQIFTNMILLTFSVSTKTSLKCTCHMDALLLTNQMLRFICCLKNRRSYLPNSLWVCECVWFMFVGVRVFVCGCVGVCVCVRMCVHVCLYVWFLVVNRLVITAHDKIVHMAACWPPF